MIRNEHLSEGIAQHIDHAMWAVLVADPEARMDLLRLHVADDFVYVGPGAAFDGVEGLSEAFEGLRHDDRRPAALRRTSGVDQHHGYFRFTWERVERGAVAMSGWCFGSVDESGALRRVVAFEGLAPGRRHVMA
jgi:hypothetical protein